MKAPNPGLSGTITYSYQYPTRNSNILEVDLASGVAKNRFVGSGGQRSRNGETAYLNPNGLIVIGKPDNTTAARIETSVDVAIAGSPGYTYSADVTRYTVALSPDGKTVAFRFNQQVWLMGLDGSKLRQLTSVNANFRDTRVHGYLTWSPNGKWIASIAATGNSDDDYIFIQSPSNDPKQLQLIANPDRFAIAVSLNPLSWR